MDAGTLEASLLAPFLAVVAARAESGGVASSTATSPGCPALEVRGTVPADGAVVPPDVVFRAVLDPAYEACYTPILELLDAARTPVDSAVASRGSGLWSLTPTDPLVVGGTYTFRVADPVYTGLGEEITVTVGEPAPPADVAPELTLEVVDHCPSPTADATVRVQTDVPVSGLLTITYEADGQLLQVFVPAADQTLLEDQRSLFGAGVVCASATLTDLADRPLGSAEATCSPDVSCPTYEPPDVVTFSMAPVCAEDPPSTRIVADLDFPPAELETAGVLAMEVRTSLGSQFPWAVAQEGPDADAHVDVQVLGGHDVCFDVVGFDATGEEAWRDGPYCSAEPISCPAEARDPSTEEAGCGCATGGGGGAGWALVGLTALARRRR